MIERDVFHIRLKNIELQAERLIDPYLKTRPIAIISSSHQNGSILCLSDEAKEEGLIEGMKVSLVRKMNHRVQLLPYNDSLYERIHYHVYQSVSLFSPTVEPKGINEFFLDMNGMRSINRSIKDTGLSIINRIEDQIGISGIVGISANKLVSSIVTSVISDSIYEVEKGRESQFLSPLSPIFLPVVKEDHVHKILKFLWIDHIGQIQSIAKQPDHFQIFFGGYASTLDKQSKGDDSSFVKPIEHKDHILEQTVLKRDTNDQAILHSVLRDLSDKIAFSLRQRKKLAKKVRLDIYYVDGYKSQSVGSFNAVDDLSVMNVCKLLFNRANQRRNRIRSILIDAWNFHPYSFQQNLFSKGIDRTISLSKAVDKIRLKHGMHMLRNASVLKSVKNHKCLST
jgi:DNA polymerase-4|tara:strand:- start:1430 stop:2617 length:1188 start_codon:yes stop_codon:yes gene_type:complete